VVDLEAQPKRQDAAFNSRPVADVALALGRGAVGATKNLAVLFDAVADDAAVAGRADRREHRDCAFEAVEDVSFAIHRNLECFVVIVSADFTFGHGWFAPDGGFALAQNVSRLRGGSDVTRDWLSTGILQSKTRIGFSRSSFAPLAPFCGQSIR
jgi:hypothetical protein